MAKREISFLAFYLIWAERQRWKVPAIHVRACHWLEHRGDLAVLRCFRGFGKSTVLGVYNAWRYYRSPTWRILHQSEGDPTAWKTSRDTQHVLRNHPLTKGMLNEGKLSVESWWLPEGLDSDPRNPSMYARGIMSNVTSARADEIQNDDVEVPRNIQNPEARERLRYRLGEQVHIAVPGAKRLFVGTPHTHDSIYDDMQGLGADCLTIRMFEHEHRIEAATDSRYTLAFVPEFVFSGIGRAARLLAAGTDYRIDGRTLVFAAPPGTLIDCYSGCAWPERFDRNELLRRRRETRTINEWDSQYQLHSKPVHQIRLDPARIIPYAVEPVVRHANGQISMWLGNVQLIGAIAHWDCSLGKINSDDSVLSLMFTDARGNLYWHTAQALTGELATFDHQDRLRAGQVMQIRELVERLQIPRVSVETNGPGGFVPPILRRALAGTGCGVTEVHSSANKQKRILDALEPPISSGFLWAHVDVLNGPLWDQMKDWNPAATSQPDDYLDSGAGAITQTPVRIGRPIVGNQTGTQTQSWRADGGVHEVVFER